MSAEPFIILEVIICRQNGVWRPDGTPWNPPDSLCRSNAPYPNLFCTDDGKPYIGELWRVHYGPHSWGWVAPRAVQGRFVL